MPLNLTVLDQRLTEEANDLISLELRRSYIDGHDNALHLYSQLHFMRKAVDKAINELKNDALNEAQQDMRIAPGVTFQVRNGSEQWDYSHDQTWNDLKAKEKGIKAQIKAREEFLRALKEELVDPETGEYVSPAQLTGYGKQTLALTYER